MTSGRFLLEPNIGSRPILTFLRLLLILRKVRRSTVVMMLWVRRQVRFRRRSTAGVVPRRRSQLLLRWSLVELLLLRWSLVELLLLRRLVLDSEPDLIENQVLDVALDGHIVSIRAQLPPQLLFNKQLDDFLLLLLLVELLLLLLKFLTEVVRSNSVRLRLTACIRDTIIVVGVVVELFLMENRNMTVARCLAPETLPTFFT